MGKSVVHLYIDSDVVEVAKRLGLNMSRVCEEALKTAIIKHKAQVLEKEDIKKELEEKKKELLELESKMDLIEKSAEIDLLNKYEVVIKKLDSGRWAVYEKGKFSRFFDSEAVHKVGIHSGKVKGYFFGSWVDLWFKVQGEPLKCYLCGSEIKEGERARFCLADEIVACEKCHLNLDKVCSAKNYIGYGTHTHRTAKVTYK